MFYIQSWNSPCYMDPLLINKAKQQLQAKQGCEWEQWEQTLQNASLNLFNQYLGQRMLQVYSFLL